MGIFIGEKNDLTIDNKMVTSLFCSQCRNKKTKTQKTALLSTNT